MDIDAFLNMGGYAGYVWPAYGLTAGVMIAVLAASWREWRARDAELKTLQAAMPGRARRSARAAQQPDNAEAQG